MQGDGGGRHPYLVEPGKAVLAGQPGPSWSTLRSPHMGYVSAASYRKFYGEVVEDIAAYLAGTPIRNSRPEPRPRAPTSAGVTTWLDQSEVGGA
jgi:hypothetical protein